MGRIRRVGLPDSLKYVIYPSHIMDPMLSGLTCKSNPFADSVSKWQSG